MSCKINILETVIVGNVKQQLVVNAQIKSSIATKGYLEITIPDGCGILFEDTGTNKKRWNISEIKPAFKTFPLGFILIGDKSLVNFTANYYFKDESGGSSSDSNLFRINGIILS